MSKSNRFKSDKFILQMGIGLIILVLNITCVNNRLDYSRLDYYDIRLFKEVSWELAKAVEVQDTSKIVKIIQGEKVDVNIREPKFGETLLIWAVENNKYLAAKKLMELNANPNLFTTVSPTSAIIASANKYETTEYLRLMLKFKGDPNNAVVDSVVENPTPLIAACGNRLESVKLLLKYGANPFFISKGGGSAWLRALVSTRPDIVKYILTNTKVDCTKALMKTVDDKPIYATDFLRLWVFDLGSEDYITKMEIVKLLKERGLDYNRAEVPRQILSKYDKEYLDKY